MGSESQSGAEAARRRYWTEQMEQAYAFMMAILRYPVQECGEPLVSLRAAAEGARVQVVFSETPVVEGVDRLFCLREGLIAEFVGAAREMNERGWILKVEDGFRTRTIQKLLARKPAVFDHILARTCWELGRVPTSQELLRRITALIATRPKIGTHMSGTAIDTSVLSREDGSELDRGGPYLEMSELTPMASPFVSPRARENRRQIAALMARHGFVAYPFEFWHFSKGDAYDEFLSGSGRPARYGAVDSDPASGTVYPADYPEEPLVSPDEIALEIDAALRRIDK